MFISAVCYQTAQGLKKKCILKLEANLFLEEIIEKLSRQMRIKVIVIADNNRSLSCSKFNSQKRKSLYVMLCVIWYHLYNLHVF